MGLLRFFIMVLLPIFLEYGVHGVSFDYADPGDFKPLYRGDDLKKLAEHAIGKDVADPTGRCPYGVSFKKDCNWCHCDPNTGDTSCTMMGCEPCALGTEYKIDCNTCVCDERTGITRCTREKCSEGTFSNCIHGTHFMKDCNRCHCSMETGKTTCTSKKCPINKDQQAGKCPHGEYYSPDHGCNTCYCNLLSGVSLCTLVECHGIDEDNLKNNDRQASKCPHGINYFRERVDCKTCVCDPLTGSTRCSLLDCDDPGRWGLQEKPVGKCPQGKHFSTDCEACNCNTNTGETSCTSMSCEPKPSKKDNQKTIRDEEKEMSTKFKIPPIIQLAKNKNLNLKKNDKLIGKCPDGIHFAPYGCKECHCNPMSGATHCTPEGCRKEDILHTYGSHAACPEGTHFPSSKNSGCNNCYCDPRTGASHCSLLLCVKGDEAEEMWAKFGLPSTHNTVVVTQLAKKENLKLKIKEAASGCTPPEVILIGSCRCDCRLPSVAVCKESCFLDPVG